MNCLKCGQPGKYQFRVLEVRTLHVRDLPGDKRIQGLGDFKDCAICAACAQHYLSYLQKNHQKEHKQYLIFGAIFLFGLVVSYLFWSLGAIRLLGLAALVCGVLGIVANYQKVKVQKEAYSALAADKQLEKAAYEYLLTLLPKKFNLDDLTYIPINSETLQLKNGDLMILYKLLPAIAVEAFERIHSERS